MLRDQIDDAINRKVAQITAGYAPGDRVKFKGKYGRIESGKITRTNRTTVSLITDEGIRWRVHTSFILPGEDE
jgi:hypothetical protein